MGSVPSARPSAGRRFQTRIGKTDGVQGSQTHLVGFSVAVVAEDPGPRVRARHLQIEAIAVREHAGLARVLDRKRREPPAKRTHLGFELLPTNVPTSLGRILANFDERIKILDQQTADFIEVSGRPRTSANRCWRREWDSTHVTVSRKHAFQACAFSHSATLPDRPGERAAPVYIKCSMRAVALVTRPRSELIERRGPTLAQQSRGASTFAGGGGLSQGRKRRAL